MNSEECLSTVLAPVHPDEPQLLARVAASQPGSLADGPALTDADGTCLLSVREKVRHD
ncbi:MAG TPA: hypothetical protein VFY35_03450 [Burkholderiaceae bacterium]|nr:hypothetical protein [Burkholderiaceae bacterium]